MRTFPPCSPGSQWGNSCRPVWVRQRSLYWVRNWPHHWLESLGTLSWTLICRCLCWVRGRGGCGYWPLRAHCGCYRKRDCVGSWYRLWWVRVGCGRCHQGRMVLRYGNSPAFKLEYYAVIFSGEGFERQIGKEGENSIDQGSFYGGFRHYFAETIHTTDSDAG